MNTNDYIIRLERTEDYREVARQRIVLERVPSGMQ